MRKPFEMVRISNQTAKRITIKGRTQKFSYSLIKQFLKAIKTIRFSENKPYLLSTYFVINEHEKIKGKYFEKKAVPKKNFKKIWL